MTEHEGSAEESGRTPAPKASYWDDRDAAKMPPEFYERSFVERAFGTPLKSAAVAVDDDSVPTESAPLDSATPVEAILAEEIDELIPDADGPWAPVGGPQFVGSPQFDGSPPIVPPGVRPMPVANAPGAIRPPWTLPPATRSRRVRKLPGLRRVTVKLLVVVILAAGGFYAYPHVRTFVAARSVPSGLRAYVEGHGVVYAPTGQGYTARLPSRPRPRDSVVTSSVEKFSMVVQRSIVAGRDFQIVVRVDELPPGTVLPFGLAGALQDPAVTGAPPRSVHQVVFAGRTAYDYDTGSSPATRSRLFRSGNRLYEISVQSKSAGTVLSTLAKSFRLVG